MGVNSRVVVPWSDLPEDLLDKIAKCLDNEIDVLRFRAVCSSWRSSTTPFKRFPYESIKLPFPFDARESPIHRGAYFTLIERTVYRVELPNSKKPNFWLVKIERLRDGRVRILNPVNNRQLKILPEIALNTLDFHISEVCKAYTLHYVNPSKPYQNYENSYAKKVVVSVGKNDEYVVMAIDKKDKLWYVKSGDEKWTMVRDYNLCFKFYDVVNYKGQFHGIDWWGGTWAFDSMFESTRLSYNMCHTARKRRLVPLSNGEWFLVEEVRDKDSRRPTLYNIVDERRGHGQRNRNPDVDIIIYALDKNEKEWVETRAVNDWIIVVGDDCSYSVSTKEFKGCNGNLVFCPDWCISIHNNAAAAYAAVVAAAAVLAAAEEEEEGGGGGGGMPIDNVDHDKLRFRGFHGENVGVCDYGTGKTGSALIFPEYTDIFWPPPSWLIRS